MKHYLFFILEKLTKDQVINLEKDGFHPRDLVITRTTYTELAELVAWDHKVGLGDTEGFMLEDAWLIYDTSFFVNYAGDDPNYNDGGLLRWWFVENLGLASALRDDAPILFETFAQASHDKKFLDLVTVWEIDGGLDRVANTTRLTVLKEPYEPYFYPQTFRPPLCGMAPQPSGSALPLS